MVNSKFFSYAPYERRLCESVQLCEQVMRFTNNVRLPNLCIIRRGQLSATRYTITTPSSFYDCAILFTTLLRLTRYTISNSYFSICAILFTTFPSSQHTAYNHFDTANTMNFTDLYDHIEDPGAFDGSTVIVFLAMLIIFAIILVHEIKPYPPNFVLSH